MLRSTDITALFNNQYSQHTHQLHVLDFSPSVTSAAATAALTLQTSVQSASLTPGRSPLNPGASTPIVAGTCPSVYSL